MCPRPDRPPRCRAGSALLMRAAQAAGLPAALREALAGWRTALAAHGPGRSCWIWR